MTARSRIAITVASAAALGAAEYGRTWSVMEPGSGDIWGWAVLASYVLAIVAVALVDRWWALLPVLAPLASDFYIQNFTDYVYPWESESIHLGWAAGLVVLALWIGVQAAVLSIGFLPRRVWGFGRRIRVSRRGPTPSPRG